MCSGKIFVEIFEKSTNRHFIEKKRRFFGFFENVDFLKDFLNFSIFRFFAIFFENLEKYFSEKNVVDFFSSRHNFIGS